jgi:protein-S-isoprenylcysteine O-methyltransferase Ste14
MTSGSKLLQRVQRLIKLRFAVLYLPGLLALGLLRAEAVSFRWGLSIVLVGLAVRSWANGYAIKMDKLTTSGPYARIRHPLYTGTLLMVIGFAVILNSHIWGVLFVLFYVAVYSRTMHSEEGMLEKKFGEPYRAYRAAVPPLWPGLNEYRAGEKWPFTWERYWRSQEYKLILWSMVLVLIIYLIAARDASAGAWTSSMKTAVLGIMLLAAADLGITLILKSAKKSRS